jgi:arylsulfatase A-like enzyme/lysophospholipase L1-like esterase
MRTLCRIVGAILVAASQMRAAIHIDSHLHRNMSAAVLTNSYTVSAQTGDVAVMAVAGNKKDSVAPVTFSSTAGTFMPVNTAATDPYPTSYSAYLTIGTNGTYDFRAVAGGALVAKTGLYVLRADSSSIAFLDSAEFVDADADTDEDQALSYEWGGGVTNGVVIEALSSRTSTAIPLDVSVDANGNNLRLLCSTNFLGASFSSTYAFSGGQDGRRTSSGVGLAFAEIGDTGYDGFVAPNDTNIIFQGSRYIIGDANGVYFQRHSDAVLALPASQSGFNAKKARTTTGISMLFKTASPSVEVNFTHDLGGDVENRNSRFAVYEEGRFIGTHHFAKTESNLTFTVHSASPGTASVFRVAFPNWSKPDFRGLQLNSGTVLEPYTPSARKKYVVLGDSISHGTGQASTYLTYPWILSELLDLDLYNLAVGGAKVSVPAAEMLAEFPSVDVITILIGYNDLHSAGKTVAQYAADLNAQIDAVRTNQPDAELFCISPTFTTNMTNAATGETIMDFRQTVYNAVATRQASGDSRIHLVRGEDITSATNLNDAVHFSEPGAEMFARELAAVMYPVLHPVVPPQRGTNVLFIAIDDLKPSLGCYGDTRAITPNIDAFAASGITFRNAHCQWSVCGPSRASLMTGLMPEETGVMGFKKMRGDADQPGSANAVIRPNILTIPQHFRYNGYRTAATGKINDPRCVGTLNTETGKVADDGKNVDDPPSWGDPVNPNNLPADFFSRSAFVRAAGGYIPTGKPSTAATNLPDSAFADGIICEEGLTLLRTMATNDTQFFLGVGFKKPHLAFVAPQQYWDLYDRDGFAVHPFQDHPANEVSFTWNYAAELAGYDDIVDETSIPESKQLELIHGYYACVSFIDAQVGRLLGELQALGLHTNTIVVLWGDHGFHLGDHAEWAKHTNLEQATRVPFIAYSPFTGTPGAKSDSPVTFTDIYPTLCELAGLQVPEQPLEENASPTTPASGRSIKGRSLVGVMNDPGRSVRHGAVNLYRRSNAFGYAYRTDRYRYTEWIQGGAVVARELYDYEQDPMETVNLAGEAGFGALMAQYSVSLREEFNQFKLSAGDLAAPALQGTPVFDTIPGSPALAGLKISGDQLSWPGAAGVSYSLLSTTNLLDGTWTTSETGIATGPIDLQMDTQQSFYRVELTP